MINEIECPICHKLHCRRTQRGHFFIYCSDKCAKIAQYEKSRKRNALYRKRTKDIRKIKYQFKKYLAQTEYYIRI